MPFLQLADRSVVIFGVSNKKSVGYAAARLLQASGAKLALVSHTEAGQQAVKKLLPEADVFYADVAMPGEVARVVGEIRALHPEVHGLVHAIAHAEYSDGIVPFEAVPERDFLNAMQVSCHSFMAICHAMRPFLHRSASVLTISISTTEMAADNYGYMAPVKAALDSSVVFLAKSFSSDSQIRVNAVSPSLLKTRASAGIPGYVNSYLYAESVIPRGEGLKTEEVAAVIAFLLSPRSSGINAQHLVVDAGMRINYFDRGLIQRALQNSKL